MMSDSNLFAEMEEEPPDKLMEADQTDLRNDLLDQSQDDSVSSSPIVSTVSMKNYASDVRKNDDAKKDSKISNKLQQSGRSMADESSLDEDLDKDTSEVVEKSEMKQRTPKRDPITPPLRRSSRPNKGIGKEIFDPSYIPMSQKKHAEASKRFDSPTTERSMSPSSSTTSSPGGQRRMVVGRSPQRRKPSKLAQEDAGNQTPPETKSSSSKKKEKEKKIEEKLEKEKEKKPISKEDFSDDDDNVPLNQLKEEEESSSSSSSDDDSDDDDSDDSYNNPDRLWCICKKPHNNRFMISCDQCEEWYHGDCVGITLQRGKKMEENNEEYVCSKCVKKKYENDSSYTPITKEPQRRKSFEDTKPKAHKRSVALDEKLKSSGKTLKGYALLGQIQRSSNKPADAGEPQRKRLKVFPDGKSKPSSGQDKLSSETDKKSSKSAASSRKCIVTSCENDALPDSVYCSNQCILRHAKESLKTMSKEKSDKIKAPKETAPDQHTRPYKDPKKRIPVICRKTQKILTGPNAPYRKDLRLFLKQHPSYQVYRPRSNPSSLEKAPQKPLTSPAEGTKSSADFYRHVESQNRKRGRYDVDSDVTPQAKKGVDSSLEKKHRLTSNVIKIAGQSSPGQHKVPNQSATNISKTKPRHESVDPPRKHEAPKSADRRDSKSKEVKRKHSSDIPSIRKSTEDKPRKVERSHSGVAAKGSGVTHKQEAKTSSTSEIRQNVRKSLFDILKSRSSSSEDLKMHHDSITRLAAKVEESLFKVYTDTTTKYKNKYRSIMFNLKDTRNHGLWRKVIIGEVTTSELVQMTAEQMASKKLAEWRRNELTQELDIIQKQEKEKANIRPVAKITHKGEIAIQENLSDLTDNLSRRDASSAPTVAPARKKRISLSEEDPFDVSVPLPTDTTNQHHEHLFDLNCKICTGKLKEENLEHVEPLPEARKKVKRSTSIILSSEAQQSTANSSPSSSSSAAPTSHIVISEQPRHKKKSDSVEESDIKSHDRSLSPASFLYNLSQEKQKKKKPILPTPPPLSDIAERDPDPDTPSPDEPSEVKDASKTTASVEKKDSPGTPPDDSKDEEKREPAPKPAKSKLIWSGSISMLELSTFKANVYPVNGSYDNLDIDLPVRLSLGGRIHPRVVWDYLGKVASLPTKQLSVVRFHAAADEDRVGYVAMLSYFSSRKRFGVVNNQDRLLVKDMYLIPLLESQSIPEQLLSCSPGVDRALPSNRPSMLLGIVVRQSTKPVKSIEVEPEKSVVHVKQQAAPPPEEEEYIPGEEPIIQDKISSPATLLTDEELHAKADLKPSTSGSLFERNRSLAPSLRFFMRKQSEEEQSMKEQEDNADDDRPYSPGEGEDEDSGGGDYDPADAIAPDEEPYDPEKMFPEEEEEYDPETAFAPVSPKGDDAIPYDPEDHEEVLKEVSSSKEVEEELVEKQAFIEKMQKELEEKKAKLAQVEQSLLHSAPPADPHPQPRVDPRLAKRAAQETAAAEKNVVDKEPPKPPPAQETPKTQPIQEPPKTHQTQEPPNLPPAKEPPKPVDPLQTILSVLNMAQSKGSAATSVAGALKIFQKPSSPPQLPDSTTKSDAEDVESHETSKEAPKSDASGLVAYAVSPESEDEGRRAARRDDRRRGSSSSRSSHEGHRRHRLDYESKKHRRHKRSRSRSPHRRGRHSPRHDDEHRSRHDRTWNRDRRR